MAGLRIVKLRGPKETTSISVGGETVEILDGIVTVPADTAALLASHGFFPVTDSAPTANKAATTTPPPPKGDRP